MANVLDRLRKLHALSKSDNPHEAALAAQLAQQMMIEHHLEEFDLTHDAQRPEEPIEDHGSIDPTATGRRRLPGWQTHLANAVARSFDCRVYVMPAVSISIVGRKTDVEAARYTFLMLVRTLTRMTDDAWNQEQGSRDQARRWKTAFRLGAVQSIRERLRTSMKEAVATVPRERALALVRRDEAVEQWVDGNLNLHAARTTTTYVRPDGFAAGRAAGHDVQLPGRGGHGLPAPSKRVSNG